MHQAGFESSVVLDGTKTKGGNVNLQAVFESSVVLDGTKTFFPFVTSFEGFESSVVLDGTKTTAYATCIPRSLRVVLF